MFLSNLDKPAPTIGTPFTVDASSSKTNGDSLSGGRLTDNSCIIAYDEGGMVANVITALDTSPSVGGQIDVDSAWTGVNQFLDVLTATTAIVVGKGAANANQLRVISSLDGSPSVSSVTAIVIDNGNRHVVRKITNNMAVMSFQNNALDTVAFVLTALDSTPSVSSQLTFGTGSATSTSIPLAKISDTAVVAAFNDGVGVPVKGRLITDLAGTPTLGTAFNVTTTNNGVPSKNALVTLNDGEDLGGVALGAGVDAGVNFISDIAGTPSLDAQTLIPGVSATTLFHAIYPPVTGSNLFMLGGKNNNAEPYMKRAI